ncbi:hypothetical protein [Pseudomonas sp. JR33AA]|uniref:hypothetical protein n=1 Tax=Pseudomonas sp. JR33AA TaxID=2899113 RepID=UPI001F2D40F2|nr:hypothetical protein [Pseudomonas sp. JR33AA]MCE5975364.1 hypothetical protein [Pseudomonas sp. JR33AA]
MTDFKKIEKDLGGWTGCVTLEHSVLQTGDIHPLDTTVVRYDRDLPTENGYTRVEAISVRPPFLKAMPTQLWVVRRFTDYSEIKCRQAPGSSARRVEEIGATLIVGRELVHKVPYAGTVIAAQSNILWMQSANMEAVLRDKDGTEDASGARRFESLFISDGKLKLWPEVPRMIPKLIEGHFLETDPGLVQLAFCKRGASQGPLHIGRVGSSGRPWEINWARDELFGEHSEHSLLLRGSEHLGRLLLGVTNDPSDFGEGEKWSWMHRRGNAKGSLPQEREALDAVEELQAAPLLMHLSRGGSPITIKATETVSTTLRGDQSGTLAGMVYTPPARVDSVLEYDAQNCKTQVSALLRSSALPGVQLDVVDLGSRARCAFVIFNTEPTYYFKVSKAQDGLRLRMFYQSWGEGEVEVSIEHIQWVILEGSGSMVSGVFKAGDSAPFTTVLAIDTTDERFWYFAVITIPCNLVTLDKALEILE